MKKIAVLLWALIAVGCSKPEVNVEEQIKAIVEEDVKTLLLKPETYELVQLKVDSCFDDDVTHNAELIAFSVAVANDYKEYKAQKTAAESAESQALRDEAQKQMQGIKRRIINHYVEHKDLLRALSNASLKHEFGGWCAEVRYSAETGEGEKAQDAVVYYLDKDLKMNHRFVVADIWDLQDNSLNDLAEEFKTELKMALKF